MVFHLTYRRPAYVDCPISASWSTEEKVRSIEGSLKSGSTGMSNGIPDALSFDRIISGGTCPVRLFSAPSSSLPPDAI